jgi:hypothetical protein
MLPIALPLFVIRFHDSSVDVSFRSSEKTREVSLLLSRKLRHEPFCKGKVEEKVCKKSSSLLVKVAASAVFRWNVRDAMSAMRFSMPAMDTEIRGDASLAWMRMASARARRPGMRDRGELSLFVQQTVGVLSHHAATCTCLRSTRCSSTK